MIKTLITSLIASIFILSSCNNNKESETVTISEELQIKKLSKNGYIHISNIYLKNGTAFPCNGFIYVNNGEAYIFDSPATDQGTVDLINWLEDEQHVTVKGVVFNHFHNDCAEGIEIFKENGIPTIANGKTKELMIEDGNLAPDIIFDEHLTLKLGGKTIENQFFGEAHSKDNIVSYFPDDQILFGGCMIKSLNAKKGNLADANVNEWSNTVSSIKRKYPNIKIVIPGHGKYGDQQLMDYTISLFKNSN